MTQQTAYEAFLEQARGIIQDALSTLGHPGVAFVVEPAREGFGDASSNAAFLLAKEITRSPREAAGMVADACRAGGLVRSVRAHPSGYLNMAADWAEMGPMILRGCAGEGYGDRRTGSGRKVSVEHTSVNPNKALHIGHVRNVVIGDTISRILGKAGYEVKVLNYIDDSGLQVADVVLGFTRLGFDTEPPPGEKFDAYCGDHVYVKTTQEYDRDKSLQEVRRRILREMEEGGTDTSRVAEKVTRRVLAAQLQTCWMLGARYDLLNYESQMVRVGYVGARLQDAKGQWGGHPWRRTARTPGAG